MEEGGGEDMNIRVVVRCRPFNGKERNNGEVSIVKISEGIITLSNPAGSNEDHNFSFDSVFGPDSFQSQVWEIVGLPILDKAIAGYNGTIFAYGQTGSGKTWSMQGGEDDLRGIIPRMSVSLFEKVSVEKQSRPTIQFLITASYFEIYNEVIFDLLDASDRKKRLGNNKGGLEIKEHPALGVYVKGLQEMVVEDGTKLQGIIDQGMRNRTVASTQMNADSSRSHSVFMITVHQKDTDDESRNIFAKINLVDLAGSERVKSTGATGATLKEGANINKSLSALGNVINALVEAGKGKNTFIPYRNSKLTRVLQESLGGNSITTMLAALSPAACNFEETLSTLKYANRAKAIKVKAVKNEEASQVSRLNDEIRLLREKLMQQGDRGDGAASGGGSEKNQQQLLELEMALKNTWESKAKISQEYEHERNRLLQEQQIAAQQLRVAKERNWSLLEEKGQSELTISHVKEVCKAAASAVPSASHMEEQIDALQRQVMALETQEKKAQDQQSVCAVFRSALEKDIQALLQIKCTSAEHHNHILIALRQVSSKAQALQEEIQRWLPVVQHASKLLRDVRRSAEALFQRTYGCFSKEGDDLREEVLRGLWLIVRQLRKRESIAAQHMMTINKAVGDATNVREGLVTFGSQYEQSVKRDVVSWSTAEDVLKVLQEAMRGLKFIQEAAKSTAHKDVMPDEKDEILPYQVKELSHFFVQTISNHSSDTEQTESTSIVSTQRLPLQGDVSLWDPSRSLVLDLQESVEIRGIHLLSTVIVQDPATRNQVNLDHSEDEVEDNAADGNENNQTSLGPETNGLEALSTQPSSSQIRAAIDLSSTRLPCGLSTQTLVDFYRQSLEVASVVPDDSAMEAIAKDTAQAVGDLLDWTILLKQHDPIKFLRRPPVRFLFDLFQYLANQYKCCVGSVGSQSALLAIADWTEVAASRETKTAYMDAVLQSLQEEVKAATGSPEDISVLLQAIQGHSGNSIVAGVDTEKTNRMLQLIALCTYRRHSQHTASSSVPSGGTTSSVGGGGSASSSSVTMSNQRNLSSTKLHKDEAASSPSGKFHGSKRTNLQPKYVVSALKARVRVSEDGIQWKEVATTSRTDNEAKDTVLSFVDSAAESVCARYLSLTIDSFASNSADSGTEAHLEGPRGSAYLAVRPRVLGHFSGSKTLKTGENLYSLLNSTHRLTGSQSIWQRISENWGIWTNVAATTVHCEQQERSKRLDEARKRMEKEASEQAQRAQSLANEKDALQTSNADLAAQLQQMVEQLLSAQQTIQELQQNVQRWEEEASHLREQVAQREQQCAAVDTQRMVLETALEKEKSAVGQLQSDLYDKEQALEHALSKLHNANKRCDELEVEREELQQAMQVLQEERDTARQHEEELFERLGDVTADLERLQESYVDICDRCNDAQDEASELRDQVESLQETLRVLSQNAKNNQASSSHQSAATAAGSRGIANVRGSGGGRYGDESYEDDDGYYEHSADDRAQDKGMSLSKSESASPNLQKKASKKSQPTASSSSSAGPMLRSTDDSMMATAPAKHSNGNNNNGALSARSTNSAGAGAAAGDEDDYQEDFDD